MRKLTLVMVAILAGATLGGCNNAKSPDAVAKDVADAQAKRASEVANARQDAAKEETKAEAKVDDKTAALNNAFNLYFPMAGARLSRAAVDLPIVLKRAQLSGRLNVVA